MSCLSGSSRYRTRTSRRWIRQPIDDIFQPCLAVLAAPEWLRCSHRSHDCSQIAAGLMLARCTLHRSDLLRCAGRGMENKMPRLKQIFAPLFFVFFSASGQALAESCTSARQCNANCSIAFNSHWRYGSPALMADMKVCEQHCMARNPNCTASRSQGKGPAENGNPSDAEHESNDLPAEDGHMIPRAQTTKRVSLLRAFPSLIETK